MRSRCILKRFSRLRGDFINRVVGGNLHMHLLVRLCAPFLLGSAVAVLGGCGMLPQGEVEDNDTFDRAMPVQGGRPVRAALQNDGDVDFYRIDETQRKVKGWGELLADEKDIVVKIKIENLYAALKIYQGDRVVKVIDDPPSSNAGQRETGFVNALFNAADVLNGDAVFSIEESSWTEQGQDGSPVQGERDYMLKVEIRPFQEDEEREPNDKPVQATAMKDNTLVRGFLDPALSGFEGDTMQREEDWYSVVVPDSSERRLLNISLSGVPNVNTRLALFDELGYLVRESNSNGIGETEKLMSIGLKRGTYYISVGSDEQPQKNMEVGYLLRLEWIDDPNSEYEPNDRYIFANDVQFDRDMYGYFNPIGDTDWYKMSIYDPEPQIISIRISPTEDIDPVLEFYGPGESLIKSADDRGVDEGEIIKNIGAVEGIYFVMVRNKNPKRDNPDSRYTLLVEKRQWQEDEEFEVNDTLDEANAVDLNGLKRGYISPKNDRDFYEFSVVSNTMDTEEPVEVTLEVSPCVLIDLAMRVYDEKGIFIEEINNNPAEEGERETLYLKGGVYFVEVLSMNDFENARDAYTLRLY